MDDIDGIRRLTKQLVDYRGKIFNEERFRFGLKKRVNPKSKLHHFFVCTLNEKVVGMTLAELIPTDKTEAYLNTLFVDNDHQKQGVGNKMYYFIVDYLRDLGIKTVLINIRKNEPMEIGFFENYGFKKDFELKPFTCMVKKLE
ncbi:MAG: GNAT family N-acetyltransferase [Candidatus Helarchaeota archaeon]|nr:GNAT family N-acetyltransferase [Candidatus Helarchaeota archaeon]